MTPGKAKFAVFKKDSFSGRDFESSPEFDNIVECANKAMELALVEMAKGSFSNVSTITINYVHPDESYLDAIKIEIARFPKQEPITLKGFWNWIWGNKCTD